MIRLLLDNKEVEFINEPDILFNYKLEDITNPTVVKNSYSKSVSIPSTKTNNKIFGDIYRIDRIQEYANNLSGVFFDPSKRTDFVLLNEGDIIESGYFQLNKIEKNGDIYTYSITLYGGLGNFLYTLMYDEEGEKIKLSDLKWNTYFNVLNHKKIDGDDFGIKVSADEVYKAFNYTPKGDISGWKTLDKVKNGLDIYDWLTFMPSYNGLYDSFDNDKCLIYVNTNNENDVYHSGKYVGFTKDEVDYELYEKTALGDGYTGYALAELSKELTEFEIRDLRAYKQRPALRLRRLIEAICDPQNNGGYEVELDEEFFNDNNPYWNDTYIALPLLDNLIKKGNDLELVSNLKYTNDTFITRKYNSTFVDDNKTYMLPNGGDFIVNGNNWLLAYPYTSKFNVHWVFNLKCGYTTYATAFTTTTGIRSSVALQLVAYNYDTDKPVAYSTIYNFTSSTYPLEMEEWENEEDAKQFYGESVENIGGIFQKGTGIFVDYNADNNYQFELNIEGIPIFEKVYFRVLMAKGYDSAVLKNDILVCRYSGSHHYVRSEYIKPVMGEMSYSILTYTEFDNLNEVEITKEKLFTMDTTPADYLLSYTKMFGLNLVYDNLKKKVKIMTRNKYFTGDIEDINDKIDRKSNFEITPLTFKHKWFDMELETDDTKYSSLYKSNYDLTYGCKRLNTNYNFNADKNKIFDGNVYKNGVTVLDKSEAFYNWKDDYGNFLPTLNVNYYEYKLFNGVGNDRKDESFYVYPYINSKRIPTITFGRLLGEDAFPKICYYDEDKNTTDFGDCLVLRNGLKHIYDKMGFPVWYSITNDIPEMYAVGDKACYLRAYPEENHTDIEWTYSLPVYTKYKTDTIALNSYSDEYNEENNNITHSLDFGSPREMYNAWTNNDSANLYSRFWKSFLEDQCNVNTRIVECKVLFNHKINNDSLRKLYFFDNSYWVLNEVEDYNVSTNKPVKCTFIKVMNKNNYCNGQKIK